MEEKDIFAVLDIELEKVRSLEGSMSIVVIPMKYADKALGYKREVDTAVRYKEYLVVGLFGMEADQASALFLSIPKGIAVYPYDGKDIQALFFEATGRLQEMGSAPWVKRLWDSIKETKAMERLEDPESRFISASFYQFLALLASRPHDLARISADMNEMDRHWVKDYLPHGLAQSLDNDTCSQGEQVTDLLQEWQYKERMELKQEKGKKTLRKFRNIEHFFTLPSISQEIIDLASDVLLAASKMARIIEKDPVLTSRVLKVVNSAFYGFHRQIDSVEHAIVILGNDEVVNLAFSIAIHKILETISAPHAQRLWEHSLLVAHLSQWLGPLMGYKFKDKIYTVGLLHDFGKIVFLQRGHFISDTGNPSSLEDLAKEEMDSGLSHAEMGAYIAERWNLPSGIVDALLCHHLPGKAKDTALAVTVHLADIIAHTGSIHMDMVNNAAIRFLSERKGPALSAEMVSKAYQETLSRVKLVLEVQDGT
ncbi:MAG TPA: HDOD domain-containing protein [Deltaproteobacteria bacterium]|nr:HDOD domain-containing protein [Deltaproteobacteria bacterium]